MRERDYTERVIYETCPKCGEIIGTEGIDVGIGYIFPPSNCTLCGWSEHCEYECSRKCTEYEKCMKSLEIQEGKNERD